MKVPFIDLAAQYFNLQSEIEAAMQRVLKTGRFILGEEVAAFETAFAAFCGAKHAIAVASGTDALRLSLTACGIGPGDEVITSPFTAVATVAAIEMTGARPVLVDIEAGRYTLDPLLIRDAITPHTRAIIPVHLYGYPANMSAFVEIARSEGLIIIEDCAQAIGAVHRGKPVGRWGILGAFSFYPTKNLGAYGDAGAILTDEDGLAETLRRQRQYGWDCQRISQEKGINSRMDEIQAVILQVKLPHLEAWNIRRQELTNLYNSLLAEAGFIGANCSNGDWYANHLYVIRHPQRDSLRSFLDRRGIQTMVHYSLPVHLHPAFAVLGYHPGDLPKAEAASREVISLPLYPEMTELMVKWVCDSVLEFQAA